MAIELSQRNVLLLHDGELADVRALVEDLGVRAIEAREPPGEDYEFAVVLASARHLREVHRVGRGSQVVRIAVLDHDARTLRALCRRAGVDLIVRRPVHPLAVRLLLLHALYRGPDRRARRVPVGMPVRFRMGLRARPALLADLSTRGCQLVGCRAHTPGRRVTVYIPDDETGRRSFAVGGRIVRAVHRGETGFAVEFENVSERVRERLRAAVGCWSDGPAACSDPTIAAAWRRFAPAPTPADPPGEADAPATCEAEATQPVALAAEPAAASDPEVAATAPAAPPADAGRAAAEPGAGGAPCDAPGGADAPPTVDIVDRACDDERRRAPRRHYEGRRVVALGDEAARVLIGRDVSPGGMRVAPNPALYVGQRLRVALYGSPGDMPLVLDAAVTRDDGERGLVLAFDRLGERSQRALEKLLAVLPVLDGGSSPAAGVVVSEILETDAP
ncbi:MAG TPA: PilZ domain-containing protein [Myxococcota bacterium]